MTVIVGYTWAVEVVMRSALIVTLVFTGTACNHDELVGCVNNSQCPEGNICNAGRCEKVCSDDSDCARGYICIENLCEQGIRNNPPTITGVVGNGSTECTESPASRCFADAVVIQGANLLGSSFRLDNKGTGPSFSDLTIGSQNTNDQVEIELPTTLVSGDYFLAATNGVGSDQTDVQILRGEPGPALTGQEILTTINTDATGRFVVARLPSANDIINHLNTGDGIAVLNTDIAPGGGGSSGSMTGPQIVAAINSSVAKVNTDNLNTGTGSDQVALGEHDHTGYADSNHTHAGYADINHTHAGGAAPLTYGPVAPGSSVAVSQTDMNSMCADSNGCRIRIGFSGFGYHDGSDWRNPVGILWGPDCTAHTDGDNWLIGYACSQTYTVSTGSYQPYTTDIFGIDGDNDNEFPRLLGYNAGADPWWVCNLTEDAGDGDLNDGYSFHTVSDSATNYFQLPGRRCYLVIED